MTPIVELLVNDIQDECEDIQQLSEEDFKRVFDTFGSLYYRCINLNSEDFESTEIYDRVMKRIKSIRDSQFMVISWLEDGVDFANRQNFCELRELLKLIASMLKNPL